MESSFIWHDEIHYKNDRGSVHVHVTFKQIFRDPAIDPNSD